jgi:nucleoside permease NupC
LERAGSLVCRPFNLHHTVAMPIMLVALVYLANAVLGLLPNIGGTPISLQRVLGYAMAPERRDEVAALGLKSIVSGTLSTCA